MSYSESKKRERLFEIETEYKAIQAQKPLNIEQKNRLAELSKEYNWTLTIIKDMKRFN